MKPTQDKYPVFEANQVLTNAHLNQAIDYLDEQERLTRANLIGIGIVCGLEIKLDVSPATIHISKGCGITSEGYLIVEPDNVALVSYRDYRVPDNLAYAPFNDKALWELLQAGEPGPSTTLDSIFLSDKAVVLFLELKKEGLRNCSPNNCDDKGSAITANVKRLLIKVDDLAAIIAEANALGGGLTSSDLESALLTQFNLPDMRLPRFDVPNTSPATSGDIFTAFLRVFHVDNLVQSTASALSAAYQAFKPLLKETYPVNPFADFNATFGFLDQTPATSAQVRFLQYYYDLFDDLLQAYDEFRWKGVELICACCPPDGLFPRHLMLGLLFPDRVSHPGIYRQDFLASSAIGACSERSKELMQLFRRLVEMSKLFTHQPSLPPANSSVRTDPQIRITPSILGDKPLSDKAIPYYYQQNGTPPLYQLWSSKKTRRNRANQNLSYRFNEYTPSAPPFISNPLRYDLEPYNFLRIEGHLGKSYQRVISTLLLLKTQYRLPIEIIALRSGEYDDTQTVDLSKESARFQDLETLYDALREELLSSLCEGVIYLYGVALEGTELAGGRPKLPLLVSHAASFRYPANSVGAWYEKYRVSIQSIDYIDVNQDHVDRDSVAAIYYRLYSVTNDLSTTNNAHVALVYYISKLAEALPDSLKALDYLDFENKYQNLSGLGHYFRSETAGNASPELQAYILQEELIDHLDEVLFSSKLNSIKAVYDEYLHRIREIKQKQFLSHFLQNHPGIQHKAGVPMGGTFILVYHDKPEPVPTPTGSIISFPFENFTGMDSANNPSNTVLIREVLSNAISRLSSDPMMAQIQDVRTVLEALGGPLARPEVNPVAHGLDEQSSAIISAAVNELADGTVIADFYLPYLVCSDCCAVQYVLPKLPPTFSVQMGCPNSDGFTPVTITPEGGLTPYEIKIDNQAYQLLGESALLQVGTHSLTIRDAESAESAVQTVTVASPITFGEPSFQCSEDLRTFTATISITGGTPPYKVNGTAITGSSFTTPSTASGTGAIVIVTDSNQCSARIEVKHTCAQPCNLPCNGIALRRGYRFWLPKPEIEKPYEDVRVENVNFTMEYPQGNTINLSSDVQNILQNPSLDQLNGRFEELVSNWLNRTNELISARTAQPESLRFEHSPAEPGTLGLLWIEHFECLPFNVQIHTTFKHRGNDLEENLTVTYTPSSTHIQSSEKVNPWEVTIPAFDGISIDKCNLPNPPTNRCPDRLDLTLSIAITKVGANMHNLSVTPSGPDFVYLWEVQDGNPPLSNGASTTVTFDSNASGLKRIQLTAFTPEGCRVVQTSQIDLGLIGR